MDISFDSSKNERNIQERGLPFELAALFEFESAVVEIDHRQDYKETRFVAVGLLNSRLHVMCFTETAVGIRVISLRKANVREVKRYAQRTQTAD